MMKATGDPTIIVGGGLMGLGIAWQLAERGQRVIVFERGQPGREASWAAAGMLAPHAEIEFHEKDLLAFAAESQRRWPAFAARLEAASGSSVSYNTTGTLVAALDRDDVEALTRLLTYQQSEGLDVRWLDGDACREREPLLSPRVVGAIDAPGDHQVDNRALVNAMAAAALSAGVEVRTNAEVARIDVVAGQTSGIRLQSGESIGAAAVVVCAGAWSRSIDGLDAHGPPTRPVKGQMLALRFDPSDPVLRHVVRAPDAYLVPRSSGRLVVGATSEERGFDRTITGGGLFELLRGAWDVLPIVYELELTDTWVGFRPGCRDNQPILGACDVAGLWFATGHYRNGIQQAPATIELVAESMVAGVVDPLLAPFTIERFARDRRGRRTL
jgi:glycine oxidase